MAEVARTGIQRPARMKSPLPSPLPRFYEINRHLLRFVDLCVCVAHCGVLAFVDLCGAHCFLSYIVLCCVLLISVFCCVAVVTGRDRCLVRFLLVCLAFA